MIVAEVMARFRGDSTGLESAVGRSNTALGQMNEGLVVTTGHLNSVKTVMGDIGLVATAGFGIATAAIAKGILGYQQEIEQMKIAFDALDGAGSGEGRVEQIEKMSLALGTSVSQIGNMNETLNAQGGLLKNNAVLMKEITGAATLPGVSAQSLTGQLGALYQSLQQGGAAASGARGLVRTGVISKEDLNRLQAAQDQGASADEIMKTLTDDMAKFNGIADQQAGTLKGLTANFHTLLDMDLSKVMAPAYDSIKRVVSALNELLQSKGAQEALAAVGEAVNHLADGAAHLVESLSRATGGVSFDSIIGPVKELAPLFGAAAGASGAFAANLLSHIPVISTLLGPLAGSVSGVGGALVGLLLSSKQTREAIGDLVGAVIHLAGTLAGVAGDIGSFVGALLPVVATIIKVVAAIIDWAAHTGPVVAILKALIEVVLAFVVIEKAIQLWGAFKAAVLSHVEAIETWSASVAKGGLAQTVAGEAATKQMTAEEGLTAAIIEQTAALDALVAAQTRVAVAQTAQGLTAEGAAGVAGGAGQVSPGQLQFPGMGSSVASNAEGSAVAAAALQRQSSSGVLEGLGGGSAFAGGAALGGLGIGAGLMGLSTQFAPGSAPRAATTIAGDAAMGASIGFMVSGGNPLGALVGGAAGAAKGLLDVQSAANAAAQSLADKHVADQRAAIGPVAGSDLNALITAKDDVAAAFKRDLSNPDQLGKKALAKTLQGDFGEFQDRKKLADRAQGDVNIVAAATGLSTDAAADAIKKLNVDITNIDPSTQSGRAAIADLVAKVQGLSGANLPPGIFQQFAPGAQVNLAETSKGQIAGSMGQATYGGAQMDNTTGILSQGLASIASDKTVDPSISQTAAALQSQISAYAGVNGMTDQYIQHQENIISRAAQVRSAHQAVADAAIGERQAYQSLLQAQLANAKAPFDVATAELALTTAQMSNTSNMLAQADGANYLSHLLSGGLAMSYTDLNSKVLGLTAAQQDEMTTVYTLVAQYQAEEQIQEALQVSYDAAAASLKQLTDAQAVNQDILKANVEGTRAYEQAQNDLQNTTANLSVQMDRYKLANPFTSSNDPYLTYLQSQANIASTQADLLKNSTGQSLTNQNLAIKLAQQIPEISFATAKAAADAIGSLAPKIQADTIAIALMQGPLDAANASLKAEKTILDPLVTAVTNASTQNVAYTQSQNGVQAATWALQGAQLAQRGAAVSLAAAQQGVKDAYNATEAAADQLQNTQFEMSRWRNADFNTALSQAQQLIKTYGDLKGQTDAQTNSFIFQLQVLGQMNVNWFALNTAQQNYVRSGGPYGHGFDFNQPGAHAAEGSFMRHFAEGGLENHIAQIAKAGTPERIWNEPETGGEAYIPLGIAKRASAMGVLAQVMQEFGVNAAPAARPDAAVTAGPAWFAPPVDTERSSDSAQHSNTSNVTIAEGAVQVSITTTGSKDNELVREIRESVEHALQTVAEGVAARGGVKAN